MKSPSPTMTRRRFVVGTGALASAGFLRALAAESTQVVPQPYFAGVQRALEVLAKLGTPVLAGDADQIGSLARENDGAAVDAAEKILDRYTLVRLSVEADGYVRSSAGGTERTLMEQGWRMFLVRVSNPNGCIGILRGAFGNGQVGNLSPGALDQRPDLGITPVNSVNMAPSIEAMWLLGQLYSASPFAPALSGGPVEYRVLQLFSRDHGSRRAEFNFYAASDSRAAYYAEQYRRGASLDFDCRASRDIPLRVLDGDGRGCIASLTIRDNFDRIYPPRAMRMAPDLPFQTQIYRGDGETVRLPDGDYLIESKRGPEYLRGVQKVSIGGAQKSIEIKLERWIDPAVYGWYSGDTHIHAAGCAHYNKPTEGVSPETVIRHVRGEALSVGDILTWGPDYYYQKQFFTGHAESPAAMLEHPEMQAANNAQWQPHPTAEDNESLIRYDVEVSGFPSSHAGHPVLLRLKDQDYPGAKLVEDWPSWNLPILQWTRAQGGVAGYAHCGHGMAVDSTDLPNYEIPEFDSCGANEAIVDATHGAVDFLSGCDLAAVRELNVWYHLLNCGFRMPMVGETDFPCLTDERPGYGRSYVKLARRPVGDAGYEDWIRHLVKGKLYCGDGRSHFLEFAIDGKASSDDDIVLSAPHAVDVQAKIAAWLEPEPTAETKAIQASPPFMIPTWHLERARIGATREVAVELVVNGRAVDRVGIVADGKPRAVRFQAEIARSSWVAFRIMHSGHTHPVFVMVGGKSIRASKRSAQWCRSCVDKLWQVKSPFMRASERPAAAEAFHHARKSYESIIGECEVA